MPGKAAEAGTVHARTYEIFRLFLLARFQGAEGHIEPMLAQLHIRSQPDLIRRSQPGQIGHSHAGSY
jgi:hypothetical protein